MIYFLILTPSNIIVPARLSDASRSDILSRTIGDEKFDKYVNSN